MDLLRKLSIKHRLWLQIVLAMVGIATIMVLSLFQLRTGLMQEKEAKVQALVQTAHSLLVGYHDRVISGTMDLNSAKNAAATAVENIRYEGKNYFWINDMHPKMVMHPIKPKLNGNDLSSFKDPSGKLLFQVMVEVVKADGEGLVHYLWPKPGNDKPVSKVSYVKGFQPWDWIIGSGIYVDDVNTLFWESASTQAIVGLSILIILLSVVWLTNHSVIIHLDKTTTALTDIASGKGDLTKRLPVDAIAELGKVAIAFNRFAEKIQETVTQVTHSASQLKAETEQISRATKDNHLALDSQRTETQMVATAITEMASTSKEILRNTESAAMAAQNADTEADMGNKVVSETVQAITSLSREVSQAFDVILRLDYDSESIGSVLDVIRGIAEQTNLLALNAAIEAARAGDQGRGFAVVADEVRTLASRTQDSTQEIQEMIEKLQNGAKKAVQVMDNSRTTAQHTLEQATTAGVSLTNIVDSVATISEMNTQVASASEQQSMVAEEINRNIVRINEVMEQTATGTQQAAAASEGLAQLAVELRGLVGQFKI